MNKNKIRIISILLLVISIMSIGVNSYSHSGRTDARGGHKDNKNKSGLGSYHYHCGGYPAHLHTNGICPYSSNSKKATSSSTKNSTSKSAKDIKSSSSKSETISSKSSDTKSTTVEKNSIQIDEKKKESTVSTISTTTNKKNNDTNTISDTSIDDSSAIGAVLCLGLLGGGSYYSYKKYRKGITNNK